MMWLNMNIRLSSKFTKIEDVKLRGRTVMENVTVSIQWSQIYQQPLSLVIKCFHILKTISQRSLGFELTFEGVEMLSLFCGANLFRATTQLHARQYGLEFRRSCVAKPGDVVRWPTPARLVVA